MKILGIECAAQTASVALLEDRKIIFAYTTNFKKTHSETLLPMIDEMKRAAGLDLGTLTAIAVSEGPGSFTGLRIGAATAKGLAFALNIPIIPVPTLEAMAYTHFGSSYVLCPMLDARRAQVYGGVFAFDGGVLQILKKTDLLSAEELSADAEREAEKRGTQVLYFGDGSEAYREVILAHAAGRPVFPPAHMRYEQAAGVAAYGALLYEAGRLENAETFGPLYLRKSQAEQEREQKGLPLE